MKLKFAGYVFFPTLFLMLACTTQMYSQWSSEVQLNGAQYPSYTSNGSIAVNGNFIHVIFFQDRLGEGNEIFYKRSTTGGTTWETERRLTYDDLYSGNPTICAYGQNVYITWEDNRDNVIINEIYYKYSSDNGLSWSSDARITYTSLLEGCSNPSISVWDSFVHLAWTEGRQTNSKVFYTKSSNNGLTWDSSVMLAFDSLNLINPNICASGTNVHLTWDEYSPNKNLVYYKRSTDGGSNWQPALRLSDDSAMVTSSSLSISGTNVYAVWTQYFSDTTSAIYFKRSLNNGINWEPSSPVITTPDRPTQAYIASSGSMLHVIWGNFIGIDTNEVNYKRSINGGVNWENNVQLSSAVNSMYPSIAVSDQVVHAVWTDIKKINGVFYRRNPTGNVGIKNINSNVAANYELKQNYPNPFNPSTKIRFAVPANGNVGLSNVKLVVYDVTGKLVTELINTRLSSGEYEVDFNASNLSSGIYFYELQAGDFRVAMKMILQK